MLHIRAFMCHNIYYTAVKIVTGTKLYRYRIESVGHEALSDVAPIRCGTHQLNILEASHRGLELGLL